jgi:hypothetical protein
MRSAVQFASAFYFALLTAGLVGCGASSLPPVAERLPGKWQGQMIVYEDAVQGKLTPEQISQLSQQRLGLEFVADGTMVTSAEINGRATRANGHWEVITQEGDLLSIKSTEQGGQSKDVNIEFDGADTFYIPLQTEVAELGAMRFTRMR